MYLTRTLQNIYELVYTCIAVPAVLVRKEILIHARNFLGKGSYRAASKTAQQLLVPCVDFIFIFVCIIFVPNLSVYRRSSPEIPVVCKPQLGSFGSLTQCSLSYTVIM